MPKEKKEKKRKKSGLSFLLHLFVSSVYFIHSFLTLSHAERIHHYIVHRE